MTFPEPGDIIDIFTLRSKLHEGALSTLFLAQDQLSKNNFVLKIPSGDILNNPIFLYHYQNEDRISRLLDHPGIVNFIHRQRSRQYIIMEHIQGKDLRSICGKNRKVELDRALSIMDQICETVRYLHEESIFHLDLKPENILLASDSKTKLIDFGLASCEALPDLLSQDMNNPQGTPWYISPEQLLGERSDPRCDIYSMGMILYEMLTGHLPWPKSNNLSVSRRRLRQEPTPPRYHEERIPPQIQSIIMRAISRHAKERYQTVQSLHEDLMGWKEKAVTASGTNSNKPSWWRTLIPTRAIQRTENKQTKSSNTKAQIVGCITNSPASANVVSEIKKQAILHSADVTLVHAIEEKDDCPECSYSLAVEGEQLMTSIEQAVQHCRRLNIDPTIRLIHGPLPQGMSHLCAEMNVPLVVIGKSRGRKNVFDGSSLRKHLKNTSCSLNVAVSPPYSPADELTGIQPDQMSKEQVLDFEVFLIDLWYEHLHYHTKFIYQLLLLQEPETVHKAVLDTRNCQLGQFTTAFGSIPGWQELITPLIHIHNEFHLVAEKMVKIGGRDHERLRSLYIGESVPLSCQLKNALGNISESIRNSLNTPLPILPFLSDNTCPITTQNKSVYGPLLRSLDLHRDLDTLISKGDTT